MLPKILILGAGYGGLTTALQLQRELKYKEADVTLVNRHNYHYFTTHLHQSAAGTVNSINTKVELYKLLDQDLITFIKAEIINIDLKSKSVVLKNGTKLKYDILIIGLGSEVETFGIKGLREHAFFIRSMNTVRLLREHIDYMFAKYKAEKKDHKYLTFVVGGAGFTGIEFIGELTDRVPILCKQFDIKEEEVRIINIEASSNPLPGFDPKLVEYAIDVLKAKGVQFIMNNPIKECTSEGIVLADGQQIDSKTIIWTGGIRGNKLIEELDVDNVRGRIKVDGYLKIPQHDDVFVIGDCSIMFDGAGKPYPPTAQMATQQGIYVARQIVAYIRNEEISVDKFQFKYRGTVASLGKGEAIGKIGRHKLSGQTASLLKNMIDNRYLYSIGGISLVLKKGKIL